ncbi:Nn.00g086540.m01.CDS01 [Neocucurbitaria sp. VM-36]
MTVDTLIFDAEEPDGHSDIVNDVDDMDFNAGDDNYMDDGEMADDPDDDDFRLDGFDDLGIVNDEHEDDIDGYDPENDGVTGQKRKRASRVSLESANDSLEHSTPRTQVGSAEAFILDEDNDDFLVKRSSRVLGSFGRGDRRKGESLPAYHKRVSHELDSDDELIMRMRDKGFTDRQIAERLAKEGRVRYDQKSVSTRIGRIRVAQAENVDFLLKEGYKEWDFKDDCLLIQAHALADIEISYEVERIRAWRFRKVSEYMRRLNKDSLFSVTACRERYNALMEGTARIPTDMDDNPDARRAELEAYRESREDLRVKEQEEKDAKEALERKAKDEARSRNAQKSEEIANKRVAKETEKAKRAMQRAAEATIRARRSVELQAARVQRNTQLKKQKASREAKSVKNKRAASKKDTLTLKNINTATTETPDPRGYLSINDLKSMCVDRGIDVTSKTKNHLVQELKNADEEYSQDDLKKMCRSKGLNANGSKAQMRYQLALTAAQSCASFAAGVGDGMAVGPE